MTGPLRGPFPSRLSRLRRLVAWQRSLRAAPSRRWHGRPASRAFPVTA